MASTTPAARGPRLNLPIFLLALVGLMIVVHLWVQSQANFAFGCTGAGDTQSGSGCADVTSSAYSTFLGVDVLVWGGLFYLTVAALRFGAALLKAPTSETLRKASFWAVSAGFAFALYLVSVQTFLLTQFCALCLFSSLTTATLFALHLVERAKGPGRDVVVSTALRPYALGLVALVVLAGADVALAPEPEAAASTFTPGVQRVSAETAECHYDYETPRFPVFDQLISMDTPYEGSADAPVRIMKIFDPNCPHCKTLHDALETILPQIEDQAKVYYKPYAIWDYSVPQSQALYLAAEEDKFAEMLNLQFENQRPGIGLSVSQLADASRRIGLDSDRVRQELNNRKYVGLIQEENQIISQGGIRSVPKLVIEGRVLANTRTTWTADCIGRLVEHAAQEKRQAAETASASVPE
ncbi:MAG: vitamin K epoxide reductase family protein [Bacteroidota bacterium]